MRTWQSFLIPHAFNAACQAVLSRNTFPCAAASFPVSYFGRFCSTMYSSASPLYINYTDLRGQSIPNLSLSTQRTGGQAHGINVATGRFAADMKVELVNDGPVTFILQVRWGAQVGE
jgi:hypothetical protein